MAYPDPVRVLLVEDDPNDAALVRRALYGDPGGAFEVHAVPRLETALEHLATPGCDAILLDLRLPDGEGIPLLEAVVRAQPDAAPVVVLTGCTDPELALAVLAHGADDYLEKAAIGRLARTVRLAIERRRARADERLSHRILEAANRSPSLQALVDDTAALLRVSCDLDDVRLWALDVRGAGANDGPGPSLTLCEEVARCCSAHQAATSCRAVALSDANGLRCVRDGTPCPFLQDAPPGLQAAAFLPLCAGAVRVGLLRVGSCRAGAFEPDRIAVLERLVLPLAVAVRRLLDAEELRASERRFRALFEHVADPAAVYTVDEHGDSGRFLEVNARACEVHGVSREALLGLPPSAIAPGLTKEQRRENNRALLAGRPLQITVPTAREDRREMVLELTGRPFPVRDGRAILVVARDITDRVRAEQDRAALREQMHEIQKLDAVGRLAAGIAHDFNNVLAVIRSSLTLAQDSLPPGHAAAGEIAEAESAARRAALLTEQLLAFSRRKIIQPRVLRLGDVVLRLGRMLRRTLGEDVRLVTTRHDTDGRVLIDRGQLEQALVNLAVNARDAMPQGGQLTIETRDVAESAAGPAGVLLMVRDTGVGMTAEVRRRLFEPFFTTKGTRGTGLGLAMVHGTVTQAGGRIEVDSAPGEGTTFRIWFPLAEPGAEAPPDEPEAAAAPTGPRAAPGARILLCEDDPGVRRATRRLLERRGYRVHAVEGPAEALAAAEQDGEGFDLLLTDIVMPGMDGRQLADALATVSPLPVVFMSGYSQDVVSSRFVLQQRVTLLHKPFGPGDLEAAIATALARWRSERSG